MIYEKKKVAALVLSVNLPPRNKQLLSQLSELGVYFEVVNEATPKAAEIHFLKHYDPANHYSIMDENQRACTFGHYLMFERAKLLDAEFTFFFEDDCLLNFDFLAYLIPRLKNAPHGLLLLGACGGFAKKVKVVSSGVLWLKGIGDSISGSHGYVLHRDLINPLLNGSKKLQRLADSYHRPRNLQIYVLYPYATWQMKGEISHIPLRQTGQSTNVFRQMGSSIKNDLLDRIYFGIWGGRFMRLPTIEKLAAKFYLKLPGCTD